MPELDITLSDSQQRDIVRMMGVTGQDWFKNYRQQLQRLCSLWGLELREKFPGGLPINAVYGAASERYGEVVLKFGVPHPEQLTEAAALRVFSAAGAPVPELLAFSEDERAILMRWLRPGCTLHEQDLTDQEKTRQAAPILARLPSAAPTRYSFPCFIDWLQKAVGGFLKGCHADQHPEFAELSRQVCAEYLKLPGEDALLHGDLHHLNLISNGSDWYAIDPKGVVGKPLMETGRFLHNYIPDNDAEDVGEILRRRAGILADELTVEEQDVLRCGMVDKVLSTCWSFEETAEDLLQSVQLALVLGNMVGVKPD